MEAYVFENAREACLKVADRLSELGRQGGAVALSGGSTPKLLFQIMRERGAQPWRKLSFFWGDERLVPAESPESNYGEFYRELIETGVIAPEQAFEATYSPTAEKTLTATEQKIRAQVPYTFGLPRFDLVILGVGEDGHTASLFPDNPASFGSPDALELVRHPQSGQPRITLTGSALNNAKEVIFLCTGENKREILQRIFINKEITLPAARVSPVHGNLEWYVDRAAATGIALKNLQTYEQ